MIRRRPPEKKYTLTAQCAAGMEELIAHELKEFGGSDITTLRGAVTCQGTLETGYRACLWSRFASRILLQLTTFSCPDPEALYKAVRAMAWREHLTATNTLAIEAVLIKSEMNHNHFAALKVKDAVVDYFRDLYDERPNIDIARPDIRLNLFVYENQASLSLDLAGSSLHRRGYRQDGGHAPLKESLAAAIVTLAGVNRHMGKDDVIIDPMCGSGTLLIEAAMIIGDIAPGLDRSYFGFLAWQQHDSRLWKRLISEAMNREDEGRQRPWPKLLGYDANYRVIATALENIDRGDYSSDIHVEKQIFSQLTAPPAQHGILVTNPPYGERLAEQEELKYLYRAMGRILNNRFSGWQVSIFSNQADFFDGIGQNHQQLVKLYNGSIPCQLRSYTIPPREQVTFSWQLSAPETSSPLANRLEKNCQDILPWAKENEISCFRLYDRDLADYDLALDVMGYWLYIHEYSEEAVNRRAEVITTISGLVGIKRNRIFVKPEKKGKKKGRRDTERQQKLHEVAEGGCLFLISFDNLFGLPLKQRGLRQLVQQMASKKRVLSLFAGTGTMACHAIMGRAKFTTSVEPSQHQLDWARKNLAINGFGRPGNRLACAEILPWLEKDKELYDLIIIDLPSYDGAKKQHNLLPLAIARLAEGGSLLLSASTGRLKLAHEADAYEVKDISKELVSYDFRDKRQLRCVEIKHL